MIDALWCRSASVLVPLAPPDVAVSSSPAAGGSAGGDVGREVRGRLAAGRPATAVGAARSSLQAPPVIFAATSLLVTPISDRPSLCNSATKVGPSTLCCSAA
eukprot:COSAG01_NODE_4756_length_4763_cov_4.080617_2_plen_102_part_00